MITDSTTNQPPFFWHEIAFKMGILTYRHCYFSTVIKKTANNENFQKVIEIFSGRNNFTFKPTMFLNWYHCNDHNSLITNILPFISYAKGYDRS